MAGRIPIWLGHLIRLGYRDDPPHFEPLLPSLGVHALIRHVLQPPQTGMPRMTSSNNAVCVQAVKFIVRHPQELLVDEVVVFAYGRSTTPDASRMLGQLRDDTLHPDRTEVLVVDAYDISPFAVRLIINDVIHGIDLRRHY